MKLPATFNPKKDLKHKINQLLKESNAKKAGFLCLLGGCENFLSDQRLTEFKFNYDLGMKIAKEITYKKEDIEELSKELIFGTEGEKNLGFYISALINKIITEEENILLEAPNTLRGIGAYQKKGLVAINGDLGDYTGYCMEGGVIVNTGDAGESTGSFMKGGRIIICGKIKSISTAINPDSKGKIYEKTKLVWPDTDHI